MGPAFSFNEFLRQDFAKKKKYNSRLSLRTYAKVVGLSPSHLCMILTDKRTVSPKLALKISSGLGLAPTDSYDLLKGESKGAKKKKTKVLEPQEFSLISEWYYYAILGIAHFNNNLNDCHWIAKKLNISESLVKKAFNDLLKYGYLVEEGGRFRQASPPLHTTEDIPSAKIRNYHKQNLKLAYDKIDSIPAELREYCTMTITMNSKQIKSAKRLIRKFREDFSAELARGPKSQVFNLCIQFFPLTHLE